MTTWPIGEIVLGEFTVERELGSGRFAVVYLVRSERTGVRYALKRARDVSAESRQRILNEVGASASMGAHSNVLRVAFFRENDEELLLFLPYCEGGSLADAIGSGSLYVGTPDAVVRRVLDLGIQTARGLGALHAQGFVHQDFKPANVLLTGDGRALLADFGLTNHHRTPALVLDFILGHLEHDDRRDRVHRNLGWTYSAVRASGYTRPYAAPEQLREDLVTPATDVFSWGCSVLEMYCGGLKWTDGPEAAVAIEEILENQSSARVPLAEPVAAVLRRALSPDAEDRFREGSDAANALLTVYSDQFGSLGPQPTSVRTAFHVSARALAHGAEWADPRVFLSLLVAEKELHDDDDVWMARGEQGSPLEQAVADLAALEQACALLDDAVLIGKRHLAPYLAFAHASRAVICRALGDLEASARQLERAIDVLGAAVDSGTFDTQADLQLEYAWLLHGRSLLARYMGSLGEALSWSQRALTAGDALEPSESRADLLVSIALGDANTELVRGEASAAVLRLESVDGLAQAVEPMLRAKVAAVQGVALCRLGEFNRAAASFDDAERTLEAGLDAWTPTGESLRLQLALRRASVPAAGRDGAEGEPQVAALEDAVARAVSYFETHPDVELAQLVGEAACVLGVAQEELGQREQAVATYQTASDALMDIAMECGRADLVVEVARVLVHLANVTREVGSADDVAHVASLCERLLPRLEEQPVSRAFLNVERTLSLRAALASLLTSRGEARPRVSRTWTGSGACRTRERVRRSECKG